MDLHSHPVLLVAVGLPGCFVGALPDQLEDALPFAMVLAEPLLAHLLVQDLGLPCNAPVEAGLAVAEHLSGQVVCVGGEPHVAEVQLPALAVFPRQQDANGLRSCPSKPLIQWFGVDLEEELGCEGVPGRAPALWLEVGLLPERRDLHDVVLEAVAEERVADPTDLFCFLCQPFLAWAPERVLHVVEDGGVPLLGLCEPPRQAALGEEGKLSPLSFRIAIAPGPISIVPAPVPESPEEHLAEAVEHGDDPLSLGACFVVELVQQHHLHPVPDAGTPASLPDCQEEVEQESSEHRGLFSQPGVPNSKSENLFVEPRWPGQHSPQGDREPPSGWLGSDSCSGDL